MTKTKIDYEIDYMKGDRSDIVIGGMIKKYNYLVKYVIDIHPSLPQFGFIPQDYYSFGLVGLWKALLGYKPIYKFSTYAFKSIIASIYDALRDYGEVSRYYFNMWKTYKSIRLTEPKINNEAIYDKMSLKPIQRKYLHNVKNILDKMSLEYVRSNRLERTYSVENYKPIADDIFNEDLANKIKKLMSSKLNHKEMEVVNLYHYEKFSQIQIGKILGFSQTRIHQVLEGAYRKLRPYLKEEWKMLYN